MASEIRQTLGQYKEEIAQEKQTRAAVAQQRSKPAPKIGMTADEVLKSTWGEPNDVNRTITATTTHEQWVYGGGCYIYLDNGIVTAIQD